MTQVFLLSDGTTNVLTWADPGNWNPVNTVECVGSGCGGQPGQGAGLGYGGVGGGGGAYAFGSNIVPTFPVYYYAAIQLYPAGATNFNVNASVPSTAVGCVSAHCGQYAGGRGIQALGGTVIFPAGQGYSGGNGTATPGGSLYGGGGGGSAGPLGPGGNSHTQGSSFGAGGDGNGGGTGASGGSTASANGLSDTQWDASHGCGGGGAGALNSPLNGGAGGKYGGGGGGSAQLSGGSPGIGAAGLIILTYTPLAAAPVGVLTTMMA